MKPLEPPDSHHLNAAHGWLGLGDYQSALDELEFIDPVLRSHPDVLAVRCEIPTIPYNLACYCARLGRLEEARSWLLRSYAIGNANILKVAARCDPDLAPLFANASEI